MAAWLSLSWESISPAVSLNHIIHTLTLFLMPILSWLFVNTIYDISLKPSFLATRGNLRQFGLYCIVYHWTRMQWLWNVSTVKAWLGWQLYKLKLTSISMCWSSMTDCWCFRDSSSSLFRSRRVLPSSAASWRSIKNILLELHLIWYLVMMKLQPSDGHWKGQSTVVENDNFYLNWISLHTEDSVIRNSTIW